jgi:hypothetical protein
MAIPNHASSDPAALKAIQRRNRRTEDPDYPESWVYEQCGRCRFWFPLAGDMGEDYGVCANARSPFDGFVRFEHDGCEAYEDAGAWVVPSDL